MSKKSNLKNAQIEINLPPIEELITKSFLKTLESDSDLKIFLGGRGSRKSISIAIYLILRCIKDPYFKCVLYRNTLQSIKESQFATIRERTRELGLFELFHFNEQDLKITFIPNGNCFISLGADSSWKSIDEPTCLWIEENPPHTENLEIKLFNTIRSSRAEVMKIYTINPQFDIDVAIEDFWFYKKYFLKYGGACEYIEEKNINIVYKGEKRVVTTKIETNHSFYRDNPYLSEDYVGYLESLQFVDDGGYAYNTEVLGNFCNQIREGRFYKGFNRKDNTGLYVYNEYKDLHISFDFNVMPYCSLVVAQLYSNNECRIIDVIKTSYPNNNVRNLCDIFRGKYLKHEREIFIYGDVDGNKDNVLEVYTPYLMIQKELSFYRTHMKVATGNPRVKLRGEWINACFKNLRQVKIMIDKNCHTLITELEQILENGDGTKLKKKIKDKETKQTYEQYGHTSDAMDYLLTKAYFWDFDASYSRGSSDGWDVSKKGILQIYDTDFSA